MCADVLVVKKLQYINKNNLTRWVLRPPCPKGVPMEKLLYFVGGIIVGSIGTLAALGFTEEELDGVGNEYYRQGNEEELGFSNEENF